MRKGETLYRIGRTYGVDERYLARINRIDNPTRLRVGERLFIPGAKRVREVPSVATSPPPSPASVKKTAPEKKERPAPLPTADAKKESASASSSGSRQDNSRPTGEKHPVRTDSASPAAPVQGKFGWPLKGEILRPFAKSRNAPSQGLEIAAPRSTAVRSAAAGRVIYSGDGIRSYGNLVILKHDDSFFTVYGFNEKNMVEAGAFVSKGDKIALSGAPPTGGKPRLYFEIRRGKEPVNPIFYLP